jgi:hypothetical protein
MIRARRPVIVSVAFAIGTLVGCTPSYTAPAVFTVTNDAVAKVVEQVIAADKEARQLDGPISVHFDNAKSCQIAYAIGEPLGGTSGMDDVEMIEPTRQIWKTLFADPQFQSGTIVVSGPMTSVGGTSSTGVYYMLTCDRRAASEPVLFDSGVRSGSDVAKALALQATAGGHRPHLPLRPGHWWSWRSGVPIAFSARRTGLTHGRRRLPQHCRPPGSRRTTDLIRQVPSSAPQPAVRRRVSGDGKVAGRAALLRGPAFRHREMGHDPPRSGSLSNTHVLVGADGH